MIEGWDEHKKDENKTWGILLIDARNVFTEINRKMMIWVARHEWPSVSPFLFNIYKHY